MTREDVLANPHLYWKASEELRDDKELMLEILPKINGHISEMSLRLRDDEDIVEKSFSINPIFVEFISDRLKDDKMFILKCLHTMKENDMSYAKPANFAYEHLSDNLKDDEEILSFLLNYSTYFLHYASDRLKGKKEMLLKFKDTLNNVLKHASPHLRDDKEFLLNFPNPLEFASERIKDDRDFVLSIVCLKGKSGSIRYASSRLRDDIGIALAVREQSIFSTHFLSPRMIDFLQGYVKRDYRGYKSEEAKMPYSHTVKLKISRVYRTL